jgi:hypothetical protein
MSFTWKFKQTYIDENDQQCLVFEGGGNYLNRYIRVLTPKPQFFDQWSDIEDMFEPNPFPSKEYDTINEVMEVCNHIEEQGRQRYKDNKPRY